MSAIAEVWGGPITSAEDSKPRSSRLREAVLAQLDDDTEVRFRDRSPVGRAADPAREACPERPRWLEADLASTLRARTASTPEAASRPSRRLTLTNAEDAVRADLVEIIDYLRSEGENQAGSVDRLIREAAFTHLNRLVAVRVAEAIGCCPRPSAAGSPAAVSRLQRDRSDDRDHRVGALRRLRSALRRRAGRRCAGAVRPPQPLLELEPSEAVLGRWSSDRRRRTAESGRRRTRSAGRTSSSTPARNASKCASVGATKLAGARCPQPVLYPELRRRVPRPQRSRRTPRRRLPDLADELPMLVEPPAERSRSTSRGQRARPGLWVGPLPARRIRRAREGVAARRRRPGRPRRRSCLAVGHRHRPRRTQIAQAAVIFRARRHCRASCQYRTSSAPEPCPPAPRSTTCRFSPPARRSSRAAIADELVDAPLLGPLLKSKSASPRSPRRLRHRLIEGTLSEGVRRRPTSSACWTPCRRSPTADVHAVAATLRRRSPDAVRFVEAMAGATRRC